MEGLQVGVGAEESLILSKAVDEFKHLPKRDVNKADLVSSQELLLAEEL